MFGITFIEQLKSSWKMILYWGGGLSLLVIFVMSIMQDAAVAEQYAELLEDFPPEMLNSLGLSDAAAIGTPEGFIAFAGLTYGTIVLAILAVVAGLDVTANDEDEGILNVLLSLPIPRWQVIVERAAAYALIIAAIAMLEFLAIFVGKTLVIPDEIAMTVNMRSLFNGCLNLIPGALALMAVTIFFASIFSRKVISAGLSAGFVLGSYILNIIGESVEPGTIGDVLARFSVWRYFETQGVVHNGLNYTYMTGLLILALVLVGLSTFAFERRDVA